MESIASRLRLLRGERSRRSFAAHLGTTESTLRNYENGLTFPGSDLLESICQKLRVSPVWLLLGEGAREGGESAAASMPPQQAKEATGNCARCIKLEKELELERENSRKKDDFIIDTLRAQAANKNAAQ